MSHVFQVQVGKGKGKYRTKYSFTVNSPHSSQAMLWYSSINTGPGYKKRLLRDGKVIARCFGQKESVMKKVARIVSTKRARNSVNGNPRWYVHLSDGTQYHTLPDASLAYGINNSDMKGDLVITIENDQITYAEPVERCQVCSEFITRTGRHSWTHTFGGIYCGTGDGATATPK